MSKKIEEQSTKEGIQEKAQEFASKYNELCKEFGLQIVFEPRWVQSKDTGDYRLQIVSAIAQIPAQE